MKLRELPQEFEKKGVKYTQMKKIVKEYTNENGEVVKDGIVLCKCLNLEYNDEYFEVFRYRTAKPHPYDAENWDMVELYPSDEGFFVFAWSCSNVNSLRRMVEKHFEDEYVAEIEKLFANY